MYEAICYFIEDHARQIADTIRDRGEAEALRYLAKTHHHPGGHALRPASASLPGDCIYEAGGYVLSYTQDGRYVGLEYRTDGRVSG